MSNTAKKFFPENSALENSLSLEELNVLNTTGYIWQTAGKFDLTDEQTGDSLSIVAQWEHYRMNALGCHAYIAGRLSYRPADKAVMRAANGLLHNVNGFGQYSSTGTADAKKRLTNWAAFGIDDKGGNKPFPAGVLEPIFKVMADFYEGSTHVVMASPVNYSFRSTRDRQGVEMPYNPNGNIAQFAKWLVDNKRGMIVSSPISNNRIYSTDPRLIRTWIYIPKSSCDSSLAGSELVLNPDLCNKPKKMEEVLKNRGARNFNLQYDTIFGENL